MPPAVARSSCLPKKEWRVITLSCLNDVVFSGEGCELLVLAGGSGLVVASGTPSW